MQSQPPASSEAREGLTEAAGEAFTSWFTPLSTIRYIGSTIIGSSISSLQRTVVNTLNPFSYITSSEEKNRQFKVFLENQSRTNTGSNTNLYPFTPNNPYDSWFTKFRKAYYGERPEERNQRRTDEDTAYEF